MQRYDFSSTLTTLFNKLPYFFNESGRWLKSPYFMIPVSRSLFWIFF